MIRYNIDGSGVTISPQHRRELTVRITSIIYVCEVKVKRNTHV